jgi:uncharacterized protein (DUF2062 family)
MTRLLFRPISRVLSPQMTRRKQRRKAAGSKPTPWQRLLRTSRYRLVIPLMRSRHSPEHSARGAMIGLFWAFTPSVGIQMPLVLLTWIVARRLFRWDFNLVLGLAWTWVTNAFTALPCYYLFYLTGQIMFGHWGRLSGFDGFMVQWHAAFAPEESVYEQIRSLGQMLLMDWGIAMLVGSLPWGILFGALGYRYSLRFIRAHRHARAERMARRHGRAETGATA